MSKRLYPTRLKEMRMYQEYFGQKEDDFGNYVRPPFIRRGVRKQVIKRRQAPPSETEVDNMFNSFLSLMKYCRDNKVPFEYRQDILEGKMSIADYEKKVAK